MSTREGGARHDGLGVLVSTTFSLFQNHKFAAPLVAENPHSSERCSTSAAVPGSEQEHPPAACRRGDLGGTTCLTLLV